MKSIVIALLSFVAFSCAGFTAGAQQYAVGFELVDITTYKARESKTGGNVVMITYKLVNNGHNRFETVGGEPLEVNINYALNGGAAAPELLGSYALKNVSAAPGAALETDGEETTFVDTLNLPDDAMAVFGGGDVIVIWPTGPKLEPCEPKSFTIEFDDGPVTIELVDDKNDTTVYPNPSRQEISIKSENTKVTYVRITDSNGNVMKEIQDPEGNINVDDLPPGTYWITITDENNDTHTLPIVISK